MVGFEADNAAEAMDQEVEPMGAEDTGVERGVGDDREAGTMEVV